MAVPALWCAGTALCVGLCPRPGLALLMCVALVATSALALGWERVGRVLRWLAPFACVVAVATPLLSSQGSHELLRLGHQAVYLESVAWGVVTGLSLVSAVLVFEVLAARVGASGVAELLGSRWPTTALVLSLGLGQVPLLLGRLRALRACARAQGARGAQLSVGDASSRLMAWALDDTLTQADSMRARGWGAGRRRSVAGASASGAARRKTAAMALGALAAVGAAGWLGATWSFFPQLGGPLAWGLQALVAAFVLLPLMDAAVTAARDRWAEGLR